MAATVGNERAAPPIPKRQPSPPIPKRQPSPVLQRPPGYQVPSAPPQKSENFRRPPSQMTRCPVPPLPPTFRQIGGGGKSLRRLCCLWLCFVVLFALFVVALAGAVAFLYVQPRYPTFRLQSLRAPRFNVTARSDGSGTYVDANTAVTIFASNPNRKIGFSYGDSEAAVFVTGVDEDDVYLGSGSTPAFEQTPETSTVMGYLAAARGQLVADAAGVRMKEGIRSGELTFRVEVKVKVEAGIGIGGGRRLRVRVPVRIECPPATLKQLRGRGKMLPKCGINWLNK